MRLRTDAFDVWVFRRDADAVRYLLLRTSQEKADSWFNGGRFWQIPCDFVAEGESLAIAVLHCLTNFGVTPAAAWVVEHTYTIYNRRREDLELILVLAAEVTAAHAVTLTWEHSEYRWVTAEECGELVNFRGLREGLEWTRRYVTDAEKLLPELQVF